MQAPDRVVALGAVGPQLVDPSLGSLAGRGSDLLRPHQGAQGDMSGMSAAQLAVSHRFTHRVS